MRSILHPKAYTKSPWRRDLDWFGHRHRRLDTRFMNWIQVRTLCPLSAEQASMRTRRKMAHHGAPRRLTAWGPSASGYPWGWSTTPQALDSPSNGCSCCASTLPSPAGRGSQRGARSSRITLPEDVAIHPTLAGGFVLHSAVVAHPLTLRSIGPASTPCRIVLRFYPAHQR